MKAILFFLFPVAAFCQPKYDLRTQTKLYGSTGLSIVVGRGTAVDTTLPNAALQSVRTNAGNTNFEWFTPGTVTSVTTGWGLLGTVTSSGTVRGDSTKLTSIYKNSLKLNISDTALMLLGYLRSADTTSISGRINLKVSVSDTSAMLSPYLKSLTASAAYATIPNLALKINISDTASMLGNYTNKGFVAATYATTGNLALKINISDSALMLSNYLRTGVAATTYATIPNLALKVAYADTAAMLTGYIRKGDSPGIASIVTPSAGINTTETVIIKSAPLAAHRLQSGTVIRCTLIGSCTSSAANISTFGVRIGTNGTAADGIVESAATSVAATTGTNIPFKAVFEFIVRVTGAAATSHGYLSLYNTGITGISAVQSQVSLPTFTNFNTTTANNIISFTYKSAAASTTATFQDAWIEIIYK